MPLDGQSMTASGARAGWARAGMLLASVAFIGALLLAAHLATPGGCNGGAYWAIGIVTAAAVALAAGSGRVAHVTPFVGGMGLATNVLTAAFLLALPGAVFALGHDGLAYPLGIGAGCLLLQLLIAPRFAQTHARSLPQLIAQRFPGRAPAILCLVIVTGSMLLLLVAELMAAGLVGERLLGADLTLTTAAAAIAVLACFIVRGAAGSAPGALLYPLLLAALLAPAVLVSAHWFGLPVPQIAFANALWQLQGMEENLLEQDLADPAFMKSMITGFLTVTPANFVGVVLALAAGVAALPSLISSPLAATPARRARQTALWALACTALVLTLVPAIAAYARQSIASLIADRTPIAELPAWMFTYGKLGLVQICGQPAHDAATLARACAALPDASDVLRLQDVVVSPDIVALALPEMANLDGVLTGLFAIAVLVVALVTAHGPLSAIVEALRLPRGAAGNGDDIPPATRVASYIVAAAVAAAAAVLALLRPAGVIDVATWALTSAAAGLFPVVVAALWWRRANAWGAAAGMLTGAALPLLYLAARQYFPVPLYEATAAISTAGRNGLEYFNELKDAWLAADPGAAKAAAWATLEAQARSSADWWGIEGPAVVLLALPVGFASIFLVSLLTGGRRSTETAP